jgi:hypothetical protein
MAPARAFLAIPKGDKAALAAEMACADRARKASCPSDGANTAAARCQTRNSRRSHGPCFDHISAVFEWLVTFQLVFVKHCGSKLFQPRDGKRARGRL